MSTRTGKNYLTENSTGLDRHNESGMMPFAFVRTGVAAAITAMILSSCGGGNDCTSLFANTKCSAG